VNEPGLSARARLMKTRRGTWVDKSLFPEAQRECLEITEQVVRDSRHDGIVEMLRGERKRLADYPLGERLRTRWNYDWAGSWRRHWAAMELLAEKLVKYELPEERDAWERAIKAPRFADTCGSCAKSLGPGDPVYFGAEVYVGFPPLRWSIAHGPHFCQPRYVRTVLCGSCAPEWLSPEREGVVTQRCAHCERPMVYLLTPSQMGRTFCSEPCRQNYHNQLNSQLRKEKRAEGREKVCEVCGKDFTATRKDAKTCSQGCKQKAYRRRKKETSQDR
jgi:predicted nucleic acid-binding Zn ribbon protein